MPNEARMNELERKVQELQQQLQECNDERRQFMQAYRLLYHELRGNPPKEGTPECEPSS